MIHTHVNQVSEIRALIRKERNLLFLASEYLESGKIDKYSVACLLQIWNDLSEYLTKYHQIADKPEDVKTIAEAYEI